MRCPNYIKIEQVVGKKKSYEKIKNIVPPQWANSGSKWHEVTPEMQVCGGEIICEVRASIDGGYRDDCCDCSPVFTVLYTCSRCKSEGYCDLPKTEEDLSQLLTMLRIFPLGEKRTPRELEKKLKRKVSIQISHLMLDNSQAF